MKVVITIPAMRVPHGGIRVLIELANHMSKKHDVTILSTHLDCPWMKIKVPVILEKQYKGCDILIVGSPHHVHLKGKKTYSYVQMLEHYFQPLDKRWSIACHKFYTENDVISISKWNMVYINSLNAGNKVHYTDTAVNLEDFPIEYPEKDMKTVLVEGWEVGNPSKDSQQIAAKLCQSLKEEGYTILVYSSKPLTTYTDVPDEYHFRPSLETINDLYRRANILIKASHMDARACAPLEAMTKGCVTVRAIEHGDDDIVHEKSGFKCDYSENLLMFNVMHALSSDLTKIREHNYKFIEKQTFDKVVQQFEQIWQL